MDMIYTAKVPISASCADRFGRLSPASMLSMMQEAAETHAMALGAGWDTLRERNLFWAVIRQSVEIDRLPEIGETLVIETWPGNATRSAYPRYSLGRTEDGEVLFRAAALWLLMDMDKRAMILPGKSGILVPGIHRENQLPAPGSLPPLPAGQECLRRVRYTELDANGHMSNTRYLNWLQDLFPGEFHREHPLAGFQISYLSEAREGEEIGLRWTSGPEGQVALEARRMGETAGTDRGRPDRVFALRARYR